MQCPPHLALQAQVRLMHLVCHRREKEAEKEAERVEREGREGRVERVERSVSTVLVISENACIETRSDRTVDLKKHQLLTSYCSFYSPQVDANGSENSKNKGNTCEQAQVQYY